MYGYKMLLRHSLARDTHNTIQHNTTSESEVIRVEGGRVVNSEE
jgi:hypothetical protein